MTAVTQRRHVPMGTVVSTRSACRPFGAVAGRGFTLIEVVIAMTIIAILAAVAIPAYTQYVTRGHRSEARGTLLQGAQWMERWRTERGTYRDGAAPPTLPATLAASPPPPATARYNITVATPNPGEFELTATPVGNMAGDPCGNYTINNRGQRGHSGSESVHTCWGR